VCVLSSVIHADKVNAAQFRFQLFFIINFKLVFKLKHQGKENVMRGKMCIFFIFWWLGDLAGNLRVKDVYPVTSGSF